MRKLPDLEKLALVDEILMDLDRPDPEIDAAWAVVARERREAYKAGKADSFQWPTGNWPMPLHGMNRHRTAWVMS